MKIIFHSHLNSKAGDSDGVFLLLNSCLERHRRSYHDQIILKVVFKNAWFGNVCHSLGRFSSTLCLCCQ